MTEEAARLFFYRGLLFGMRAVGLSSFPAQGGRFLHAFESTIQLAENLGGPFVESLLGLFSLSPHAREMLREGEDDAVLRLTEPDLREANFVIDEGDAERGLERLGAADAFRQLGRHFRQQLAA